MSQPGRISTGRTDSWSKTGIRSLTPDEKRDVLAAVEELARAQAQLLAARGGRPFSPSWELLEEQRAERADHLLHGSQE